MPSTRFLAVLTVGWLLPFSLSAQSVSVRIPQPAINLAQSPPLAILVPQALQIIHDESDRDLPIEERETIQKSFSMAGVQHRSLEINNVGGSFNAVGTNSHKA